MKIFKKTVALALLSLCTMVNIFAFKQRVATEVMEKELVRVINLEKTTNTREMGGYPTSDGKVTKYGAILRSNNTYKSSERDIKTLKKYGVTTVIDLRSEKEIASKPDKFASVKGVDYHVVDIKGNYKTTHNLSTDARTNISDNYVRFIKYTGEGNWQKKVFDIIANSKGAVLFHCIAGKDRTGMVAAILLGLVGVGEEDIINNYIVTFDLLKGYVKEKSEKNLIIVTETDATLINRIKEIINYIIEKYDTFENYLRECGISQKTLDKIKSKFCEKIS